MENHPPGIQPQKIGLILMTETSIQLAPRQEVRPRHARAPLKRARRWLSLFEDELNSPLLSVFVTQHAYVRICAHAGSNLDNEVGGWLVGKWRADRDSGDDYVVIEAILPARYALSGSTFLTFTQDSQVWLYNQLQERFPNKDLLGWYHTHPKMGIFLSQYDMWLHQNFFPQAHHVALVIEPHSRTGGFFIRDRDGELDAHRYFGFYELVNKRQRSVVHWKNIHPAEEQSSEPDTGEQIL